MKTIASIEMADGHRFSIRMKKYNSDHSEGVGMVSVYDGSKMVEFGDESEYDARPAIDYIQSMIKSHGKVKKQVWYEKEYGFFDFMVFCNFKQID